VSIAQPAASALLQSGLRQRIIEVKQALALRHVLIGLGADVQGIRTRLAENPTGLDDAILARLVDLLPPALAEPGADAPFRPLARLGSGPTGTTWLALGQTGLVAAKVIHRPLHPGPGDAELLHTRLQALCGGGHRYLVNYLAAVRTTDGGVALVAEYRQGRDCWQRAAVKGMTSEARALTILRQAAKGLAILHHDRRCHGNLHPRNILLDADGRAALGDYALCGDGDQPQPRSGWSAGALSRHAWAAPEEWGDAPRLAPEGDLYALGCIGYWLMAGEAPFAGTPEKQRQQHAGAERPDVRELAKGVSELTAKTLLKMMQIDPAARYHDARSLVHSLERNLDQLDQARVGTGVIATPSALERRETRDLRDDSGDGNAASSLVLMEPQ
jgi:serine/threonine protein kinase